MFRPRCSGLRSTCGAVFGAAEQVDAKCIPHAERYRIDVRKKSFSERYQCEIEYGLISEAPSILNWFFE